MTNEAQKPTASVFVDTGGRTIDADSVTLHADVEADGDAAWAVVYRIRLEHELAANHVICQRRAPAEVLEQAWTDYEAIGWLTIEALINDQTADPSESAGLRKVIG